MCRSRRSALKCVTQLPWHRPGPGSIGGSLRAPCVRPATDVRRRWRPQPWLRWGGLLGRRSAGPSAPGGIGSAPLRARAGAGRLGVPLALCLRGEQRSARLPLSGGRLSRATGCMCCTPGVTDRPALLLVDRLAARPASTNNAWQRRRRCLTGMHRAAVHHRCAPSQRHCGLLVGLAACPKGSRTSRPSSVNRCRRCRVGRGTHHHQRTSQRCTGRRHNAGAGTMHVGVTGGFSVKGVRVTQPEPCSMTRLHLAATYRRMQPLYVGTNCRRCGMHRAYMMYVWPWRWLHGLHGQSFLLRNFPLTRSADLQPAACIPPWPRSTDRSTSSLVTATATGYLAAGCVHRIVAAGVAAEGIVCGTQVVRPPPSRGGNPVSRSNCYGPAHRRRPGPDVRRLRRGELGRARRNAYLLSPSQQAGSAGRWPQLQQRRDERAKQQQLPRRRRCGCCPT